MARRTNRAAWTLCGLLLGTALMGGASRASKLYPVDEGPKDRSFVAFRSKLIDAAKKRDQRFLLNHLDSHVLTSPFSALMPRSRDGGRGIDLFKRTWHPENSKSDLWPELIRVLSLGGAFKSGESPYEGLAPAGREFVAPYVRSQWPDSQYPDSEEYGAILGKRVPLRRRPTSAAPVVDVLSYDIVKTGEVNEDWVQIVTPKGKQGYVAQDQIRSAADTEAHFARKDGRWVMTCLFETFTE